MKASLAKFGTAVNSAKALNVLRNWEFNVNETSLAVISHFSSHLQMRCFRSRWNGPDS